MYFSSGTQLSAALAALPASKAGQFLAFDALFYSNTYMLNGNTTGMTAIEHFVQFGAPAMAWPNPTFDPAFYKQSYADLSSTDLNAADLLYHFMQYGLDEGRFPNEALKDAFDADAYLAAYPSVAAYVNANLADFGGSASNGAIAHYVKFGMAQGFTLPEPAAGGTTFALAEATAASADVMRLTGDQAVRIDFTANDNQVKGLDLDADGTIENNGIENNNPTALDDGKDFEIVDAYKRDLLNENNIAQNYLGNISYDGTGFAGDGVNTDGNIFLGGLGVDIALGGIGNDFLAGGGVAQTNYGSDRLDGGRNADFFFAELSLLDNTDGNGLRVNGGSTSDDAAVGNNTPQDSDWLLLEASDDEDGTVVDLETEGSQSVVTGAGRLMTMTEVENVDASGNLYGFLDDVNVAIGGDGKLVNGENVAIGASAQLHIIGSDASNILIGGYDNDLIEGMANNDLLMGGNLNYALNNVNAAGIVNNGMDELYGNSGDDNIVFEADGGIIEGDTDVTINDGESSDTLWLTRESFGTQAAADLTVGGLRFDLLAENLDDAAGYGGADAGTHDITYNDTQDQTNYVNEASRVQVRDMENVIATGLGAVDYLAAGTNDPELSFNNQQNHFAVVSDLDLRGTGGDNTLYAAAGNDTLEGRVGDDLLSGGDGVDRFVFDLGAIGEDATGDGLDVIWRQSDVDGNNLWDVDAQGNGDGAMARNGVDDQAGLMEADFGQGANTTFSASRLTVDFTASDLAAVNKFLIDFSVKIGDSTFAITSAADLATLKAATNATEVAAIVNSVFGAIDSHVTATASGNVVTITDAATATTSGREMTNISVAGTVTGTGETFTNPVTVFAPAGSETIEDQLLFAAYNDRADGELVDDDAVFGGDTLGANNYAQDLVVGFNVDGSTVIAERQAFRVDLTNLAVQDAVTVTVNGVQYSLTVGRALDNTLIANETTEAFATRLSNYINDYLDDDTAAGKVTSTDGTDSDTNANTGFFTLTQAVYSGEETVFMNVSVDVDDNSSNGQGAVGAVTNLSSTDITLYEYDGRDAGLNAANVLFVGDSGVGPDGTTYSENSRAILATAASAGGDLLGSDAIVVNVTADDDVVSSAAEGVDGAAIYFNDAENPTTGRSDNYAIHGDDQLFGGNGADTVTAGTGDDRVYGSLGLDTIDGGKDLYLVDGVIRVLNDYEAGVVDALPATLKIELIADGAFDDTLVYQQSDFGAVGAGGSTFNIALDLSALQANGGAGRVITNGAAANTTLFTNMENIRTVSGNGTLAGQGNDTLDMSITVNPLTGATAANSANMRYFLTKEADQGGEVRMFTTTAGGDATGAGDLFTKVDGVEHVLGGLGTDYLYIDQTESGKNNSFNASTSTAGIGTNAAAETLANGDKIIYENNGTALTAAQLPNVVLAIGANNVDTVTMTAGQLPAGDAPVDTLTGVEFIDIGAVAQNVEEADELDVSALTSGATVDFTNSEVDNGATLVATVIGMTQFELVTGSTGDDTVVVADAMTNASADAADPTENAVGNILFDSFLTYDVIDETIGAALDTDTTLERMTVADLRAVTGASEAAAQAAIDDAINQYEYTFDLGAGTSDRVDYSDEAGAIAAVIEIGELSTNILVDQAGNFASLRDVGDRIDVLSGVEEIVAAQGDSVLDFTNAGTDVQITFQYGLANAAVPAEDDQFENTVRIADGSGNVIAGLSAFVERYTMDDPAGVPDTTNDVTWNRIEGSDSNEEIFYAGSENLVTQAGLDHRYSDDELNLRGGDNGVSYTAIETSITVDITVTEDTGTGNGVIEAVVDFQDGNSGALANAGTHTITSYGADNTIAAGTLKIEASQDAEDTVSFTADADKIYLLGVSAGVLNVEIGTENSMILTGFEILIDAGSDDVYDMADLETVQLGMALVDNIVLGVTADRDTIKVANDAIDYNGGFAALDTNAADTINLEVLNDVFHFDFDVLDITNVTDGNLIIIGDDDDQDGDFTTNTTDAQYVWGPDGVIVAGGSDMARDITDDVIIGSVDLIDSINGFANIWLTNASIASAGASYELDIDASELLSNNILPVDTDTTGLNFSLVTSAVAVTVTDVGAVGAQVVGTALADTITGGAGNDTITGGGGADVLDGNFIPAVGEVQVITLGAGVLDGVDTITIDNGLGAASLVIASSGGAGDIVLANASSDEDQVGTALANFSVANWNAQLDIDGVGEPLISSVTYNTGSNELRITYAATAQAAGPLTAVHSAPAVGDVAPVVTQDGAGTSVDFAAQTDSADTFVVIEGDSTEAAMDEIYNFSVGAVDDLIDFTGMPAMAGHTVAVFNGGSAFADYAAVKAAAAASFVGDDSPYIGSDGTDTWIFIDDDHSATLDAGEGVIKLVGIDATGIDLNNFVAW